MNLPASIALAFRRGLRLPPSGWALAGMLAFYVVAGLFGRDPWKGEDAIHLGTAFHILSQGDWLSPQLAGRPFHEPPLYYWSAALTGQLFSLILPLHDAMRLASGGWTALALTGLYYAGREIHGQEAAAASPLLLAGAVGLLIHAHDAQPMLVALAAYGGALGAMAAFGRKPTLAGVFYGLSLAACLLGAGIAPTLPLLLAGPLAVVSASDRRLAGRALGLGLGVFLLLGGAWPLALHLFEPARLADWLGAESRQFAMGAGLSGLTGFVTALPWFAFPIFPLAAWALWRIRRQPQRLAHRLPLTVFALTLVMLALAFPVREIPALLLLPPLALIATPGALSLRRGAANAFDWFAMMTFTFGAGLVWLAWSAMALGVPARLAQRVIILRPGFVGHIEPVAVVVALAVTLWWLWLIVTAPRSPYRSLTHWTLGFTTFWLLSIALLLPWFDYGKSYRPVAQAIAHQMSPAAGCLAEQEVSTTLRASLTYFVGIEALPRNSLAGGRCPWLLVQDDPRHPSAEPEGWHRAWEGNRPGDKRERLRLYRRP